MTILEMSLTGGVLIAAILLLRRFTLFRLPKWNFLLLWAAALCRLLLPFSVSSPFSLYTGAERLAEAVSTVQEEHFTPPAAQPGPSTPEPPVVILPLVPQEGSEHHTPALAPQPEGTGLSPMKTLYLLGAALCALWFTAAYLRCLLAFRDAETVRRPSLDRWQSAHPRPKVRFRSSKAVSAPLTYGLLRPTILFPDRTDWDDAALPYILAHEYVHIRRGDVLWKLLLAAALCVHWFNPAVWTMYIFANRDLELACDEAVVHSFGLPARPAYALSLLHAAESRPGLLPLCSGYKKTAAEERILAIMKTKKRSLAAVLTGAVIITGAVTVFATGPVSDSPRAWIRPDLSQLEPARPSAPIPSAVRPAPIPGPVHDSAQTPNAGPEPDSLPAAPPTDPTPEPGSEPASKPQPQSGPIEYPVNRKGHTYGAWTEANGYDSVPDLLYVQLDQGTSGYVFREEMYPYSYPLQTEAQKEEYLDWYMNHKIKTLNIGPKHESSDIGGTYSSDALVVYRGNIQLYDQEEGWIGICPRLWAGVKYGTREEAIAQLERGEVFAPSISLGSVSPENIPANRRTTKIPASGAEELIEKHLVNGDWPRNSAGQTYGSQQLVGNVGYYPDLLAETTMDGTPGYVRYEDSFPCGNPEVNVVTYQLWLESQPYIKALPVYDLENHVVGVTLRTYRSPDDATKDDISMTKDVMTEDLTQLGYSSSRIEEVWTAAVSQYGWVI